MRRVSSLAGSSSGAFALAALLAIGAAGCGSATPTALAREFLSDWAVGRFAAAAQLSDGSHAAVSDALSSYMQNLNASNTALEAIGSAQTDGHTFVRFRARITLAGLGPWQYAGRLAMVRRGGRWQVAWQSEDLNPALGPGENVVAIRMLAPRAPLLDRSGTPLEHPAPVVTVGVVGSHLKAPKQTIAKLARVLGVDGGALAKTVAHTPGYEFIPVITLRRAAYERVKPVIHPLAGVYFRTGSLPLAPTVGFARAILGQVGPASAQALRSAGPLTLPSDAIGLSGLQLIYQQRLAGTPSGRVEVIDSTGQPVATLFSLTGHPGVPVQTTLSLPLQSAAEKALPLGPTPAALIAVKASTGQILAAANRPAESSNDLALDASYPPGSSFKVITTAALFARGFDPHNAVSCPPAIAVDGKRFTNFAGEAAPGASFVQDFAQSCNAAFISLAPRLASDDLAVTARRFGFQSRWQLPLAYYSGQAPPPGGVVEKAGDMIGQGRVLASPLNMALVAAAVDSGAWRAPTLISDPPPAPGPPSQPLSPRSASELRTLMRAVVTSGTGTAANLPGAPVYGKTGTAEYGSGNPPPTDAWFIGFRRDLAFAVIVQGGGVGGQVAAPIAARFLRAAPPS